MPRRRALEIVSFGEAAVADEGGCDANKRQEVAGASFVAAMQAAVAGEPRHGSLDHPTVTAQPQAGLDAAPGDPESDPASTQESAQESAQVSIVVGFLAVRFSGPSSWPAPGADRRDPAYPDLQSKTVLPVGPEIATAIGRPPRLTIIWIFEPFLPRSTGFGPVSSPL